MLTVSDLKADWRRLQPCLGDEALREMLAEDVPFGDLTTQSLGIGGAVGSMVMCARRAMRVCGTEEAARLVELAGGGVLAGVASGSQVVAGEALLRAEGSVGSLQTVWKTAQTLIEYLSGISTCAATIIHRLREAGFDLPLACTRKNFPGTRHLSAKAVMAGGAVAHRLGLSETLLVFPDHRVFVDKATLPTIFSDIHRRVPEKKLVAEAADLEDAIFLAQAGADVLQLERFSPQALAECRAALGTLGLTPLVAPAGGVTVDNALAYARAGADFLVSSAPYFAPPCDVAVTFSPLA